VTFKLPNNFGFTLLENLVAVALLTSIGGAYSLTMSSSFKSKAHIQDNVERESLAAFFASATSCADTLPSGQCTAGNLLNVKRRLTDGTIVTIASNVVNAGTAYGAWTVRGECEPAGNGVLLRVAHLAAGGDLNSTADSNFRPDPLTQKITHWSDDDSLLLPKIVIPSGGVSGLALCTGGVVKPMRTEVGADVLANLCTGSYTSSYNLCNGTTYKDVTFSQAFNSPPNVIVSISSVCDEACANQETDSTYAYAQSVTASGFRLICNGSPPSDRCGSESANHCAGHCSWMAIGN
jgi:Tfp pilus assembly protein PilV